MIKPSRIEDVLKEAGAEGQRRRAVEVFEQAISGCDGVLAVEESVLAVGKSVGAKPTGRGERGVGGEVVGRV